MPFPKIDIFTLVALIALHPLFSTAFSDAPHVTIAQIGIVILHEFISLFYTGFSNAF